MEPLILGRGMSLTGSMEDYPSGIVIPIDKPWRWTSADVIRKVKWAACKHFGNKKLKVGHAGTLDPLATGVLLVCIGKATKLADELQRHEKEYLAGVVFGATTPSYDREKEIDRRYDTAGASEAALREVLPFFLGEQEQVAPLFSAKSVDGVRAYELARKAYKAAQRGDSEAFDHSAAELLTRQRICITEMEMVAYGDGCICGDGRSASDLRAAESLTPSGECGPEVTGTPASEALDIGVTHTPPIEVPASGRCEGRVNPKINVISLEGLELPWALIRVGCSKGTYIRALARDLGEALGSGAFLGSLRRTRTGGFKVEDSLSLSEVLAALAPRAE